MDCPECGTWNPDDRIRCWRCGAGLPEPAKPKRKRRGSGQLWLWVVAVLLLIGVILVQCRLVRFVDTVGVSDIGPLRLLF